VVVSLRKLWERFDAFGRRFISGANPVLGSSKMERELLEQARCQQQLKQNEKNDG
jgi:hypothetical protein